MPRDHTDRRSTIRHWLLLAGIAACLLTLVVAVVGLAGGFERVPPEELPVVAEDEPFEGEPWNVTVEAAVLEVELEPPVLEADNDYWQTDGYWLVVVANVTLTADDSWAGLSNVLYVTGVAGLANERTESSEFPGAAFPDGVQLVRDRGPAAGLHPGLPERLAFLWELGIDTPPPTEVHVEITGGTYRESSLTGYLEWLDAEPRAQLDLPVEDRREVDGRS